MQPAGAVTGYIDVAQIMIYLFWAFFAGLILYLRREDKREGYPLESERSTRVRVRGFPEIPAPKRYRFEDGSEHWAPSEEQDSRPVHAEPVAAWPGAALEPVGDPMQAGVGPGAVAIRPDAPETLVSGDARVRPMRALEGFHVAEGSPDPRGMTVVGADGVAAGTVADLWIDLAESQLRYLEVVLADGAESGGGVEERRLLPIAICRVDGSARRVRSGAILAEQFARVPRLGRSDVVTMMEEERITAYYGAGYLYATPERREAFV